MQDISLHSSGIDWEPYLSTGLLTGFVEVVRSGQKEKVVRTGLLALKQLLSDSSLDFGPDLVEAGLLKIVTSRAQQVGLML